VRGFLLRKWQNAAKSHVQFSQLYFANPLSSNRSNATRVQTQSKPENDEGGESDSGEEVGGQLVVASGDASKVLKSAESVLDEMTIMVAALVIGDGPFSTTATRNDRHSALLTQGSSQ
jgi:hypothetical protein